MSQPYIGEIRQFGGNFAPSGWMFCNGQLLSISDYDTLFNLIGTTYGGDGQNTFALPNLQGRVPLHQGSGFTFAQSGGTETVTLNTTQLPSHNHPVIASDTGGSDAPAGNVWAAAASNVYAAPPGSVTMNPASITPTGGGQPHDNMHPFLAISFIISLFGIYPSQG